MAHPGFAAVQVRTELSLTGLCALYWDGLSRRIADEVIARNAVEWVQSDVTNPRPVQDIVREQLGWYGERSVDCGPQNEYPSDEFEAQIKAIVARAYKIVY